MVHRILFWTGFGLATRAWQLGLEMRPFVSKNADILLYPLYGGVGASFGWWLQGVDERQKEILEQRKQSILEKRARRALREQEGEAATS